MSELLDQARAHLESEGENANRLAAWFARGALEEAVVELLRAKRLDIGRASHRARLTCLESLYRDDDPVLVVNAQYAWSRLSEACHQHAFEMTPTGAEVASLIGLVTALRPAGPSQADG